MNSRSHIATSLIFIALAAIYFCFPARIYYWDGITFAEMIKNAGRLSPSLVHPNHLIYNFAGYLFYKLLRSLNDVIRPLAALQIMNYLLSALSACVFAGPDCPAMNARSAAGSLRSIDSNAVAAARAPCCCDHQKYPPPPPIANTTTAMMIIIMPPPFFSRSGSGA